MRLFALVTALASVVPLRGAVAQTATPLSWTLEWQAPAGCPDADAVRRRVAELVGSPTSPSDDAWTARAAVTRESASSWRMQLETARGATRGERALEAASCAELADATAVILALIMNPAAAGAQPDATPAPAAPIASPPALAREATEPAAPSAPGSVDPPASPATANPPADPPSTNITTPAPAAPAQSPDPTPTPAQRVAADAVARITRRTRRARRAPRGRFVLGAAMLVDVAMLPGLGAGVAGYAGYARGRWRFEASVAYWPTRAARLANRMSTGGDLDVIAGALAACYMVRTQLPALGGCLGVEAGATRAVGVGVSDPISTTEPWVAVTALPTLAIPVGDRFALRAQLGAAVPVVRPEYVLTGVGTVYQSAPVVLRGAISAEVHF